MGFIDNRQFMDSLEKAGDLLRIEQEVDWDLEAGAVSRRACELGGPATLFEKLKDYPPGFRILGAPLGTYRRVAIALGLPADAPIRTIYREYQSRQENLIKPAIVKDGPCKENAMVGENVDLYRFPAPMCHEGDGGRYLATWTIVVSQDTDTGWTNWGMYRFMIHNRRFLVGNPAPVSHLGTVLQRKFMPKNQPMPVAVVIGGDPLCSFAAAAGRRAGEDEADFAGALHGKPVEVVKCETNNLLVPAHAEIVIEGEILPDATALEGPFGEYSGYRNAQLRTGALCRVTAITYRNSPIVTMSCLGTPCDDMSIAGSMNMSLSMKRLLVDAGVPVVDVYVPPEGASHMAVASVSSGGKEVAEAVRDNIAKRRAWLTMVVVVDNDVDVFNMGQVIHAMSTKCHPVRGISIKQQQGIMGRSTPYYSREERKTDLGAVALLDCTWPPQWTREDIPVRSSFDSIYSEQTRRQVLDNWKRYGFQ